MKLILIITDYGSFNNFISELAEEFVKNSSNELHIICSNEKVINVDDKVKVWPNNIYFHFVEIPRTLNLIRQLSAAFKINRLIKKIKPNLVHVHFTTATFTSILFRVKSYLYWSTIHGLGMNSTNGVRQLLLTIVEHICFTRVDKIFVLNFNDYNYLQKSYRDKVVKQNCLGMGCNILKYNLINFSSEMNNGLLNRLEIPQDSIVISFIGRYTKFKGFHIVIKTFMKLCIKNPGKFKLLLMGGVDPIHTTGLSQIEKVFFNESEDIINIGFTNEVEKYLAITNIFIFPSKKEGLPTCILEALSMGVPVIAYDARGINDVILNHYNGILIPESNPILNEEDSFVETIINLLEDKEKLDILKNNALINRLKYSRDNFVYESIQLYQTVLAKH
jgi:glycosyltransferase involved in cell wall biosynthesis